MATFIFWFIVVWLFFNLCLLVLPNLYVTYKQHKKDSKVEHPEDI